MSWPHEAMRDAPQIGLGLAALGRPAYITTGRDQELGHDRGVDVMRLRTFSVLDAAYAAGVRYVDVARSYGCAEDFLAGWLAERRLRPADIAVGSKWGYTYIGGWRPHAERHETQELSLQSFERQSAESQALLGEHLALYQIHSATPENAVLSSGEVLDALRGLRERQVAIGVTVSGPDQPQVIDEAIGLDLFDAVQATWNLLEPSSAEALGRAHAAGLTVIVKEAVANGRLTDRGDQPQLIEAAHARGVGADTLAISAALTQPWADVVLSGAVTVEDLRSNLAARPDRWDAELAGLAGPLARPAPDYWKERSQRAWA